MPDRDRYLRALAVVAAGLLFALPLVYLLTGALRPVGEPPPRNVFQVGWPPTAETLRRAFELVPLAQLTRNSLLVALPTAVAATVSASWAGFVVARASVPARRRLTGVLLVLLMVPAFALWLPRFVLFRGLGAVDSYIPLIAPALIGVTPFTALLCLWSFRRVPRGIWEAASLEGATPLATWWRVGVPLTRGTHLAVGVIAFAMVWGSLIEPLLYLDDVDLYTLPLGLRALQQLSPTAYPLMLAGGLVATVPVVVGFALVQRWFVAAHRGARWLGR